MEYEYEFPCIPYEIIVEILLRVPATSLMRFKCVSKSWHALFSNHGFITTHVKINRGGDKLQLMKNVYFCGLRHRTIIFSSLESMLKDPITLCGGAKTNTNNSYANCMMRSCDGLICIFQKPNYICICNPATRKCRSLPLLKPKKPACFDFIGFGYHEPSNDYKVVLFQCPNDIDAHDYEADCMLHVYSLNTQRWDSVDYDNSGFARPSPSSIFGVFLNNKPYWLENADAEGIRCYDLASCKFEAIEEPQDVVDGYFSNVNGGSLGVLDRHVCLGYAKRTTGMDLWLLNENANKEYSWNKFVSINLSGILKVLPIYDKGEILTVVEDNKYRKLWLMIYDSQVSSQRIILEIPTGVEVQMTPLIYVESLISI